MENGSVVKDPWSLLIGAAKTLLNTSIVK